ncbi:hypothetical protein EUX98_g8242 [Antrodiella citrinella]|uniref:Ras-GAP domain-containing protein n=1 Tax=Antrodiella citrinella TaxID=2447956 RepID=A0A4S4M9Q8_9APHY|nr:hypothetical protein EUX98_g8242 [Antrodiella citrinella]
MSYSDHPVSPQSSTMSSSRRLTNRNTNRYSVTALFSMAAEQDVEVEDELGRAQKRLRELKSRISAQSKRNFVLERDVRFLDSRIGLLIQNRMALDEQHEVEKHLEDVDATEGHFPDDRKLQQYSNLFFLLQSEPRHIASLCRLVSLSEIDTLLQTVMFTLYGNQYESREEHLLLTMFQSVLSSQFETATEFGSLLRANTPVSRMMTTYTRRGPGQSYLKSVLAERINSLIEHKDLNLEINPVKVYEQMIIQIEEETGSLPPNLPRGVPPEVAAANPDVQAIIAPRLTMLMEIANSFLLTIIDSKESVPYGIRWICKQIRSLTRRKYPEATDYAICSLIGGFFFLRFINPAIVTPQAYMLVDGVPAKFPRRTLTLIAKMLQNLANKPSYAKEAYMITLNPFVEDNKARINQFLNDLCEVGDFYDTLEMDQYMALSKKDLVINITLNELYNTHSLILQHVETLSPNDKQHLRILTDELGAAPAQVPRKENRAVELSLYSRWETPIQDIQSALMDSVSSSDMLYMETKSILVQLVRSLPGAQEKRPYNLSAIAERAATTKDATLVRKGIKVKEMLRELEEQKVVDRNDGYKLMQEEVAAELVHLGNLREKVLAETKSLDAVYKTICDHNNYLRGQLEQYKAYLQNVRLTSSKDKGSSTGVGVVTVGGKEKKAAKPVVLGPYRFTHAQLEKEGIIVESNVPDNRRPNIYFNITSPTPGTFIIALHYKGREKAILEMDLNIDDLLEKQKDNKHLLDLESYYIVLQAGSTNFRVALDTASADLWLVASSCNTPACAPAPKYQLGYHSGTFGAVNNNETAFETGFSDGTTANGFVGLETVQISNLTIEDQAFGIVTSTNVSSGSQISGILGLGFPRLSRIFNAVNATPVFSTMSQRGQLDYPLFGLSLTRNQSGSLTFGAVDGSVVKNTSLVEWSEVVPFSPFAAESNASSYLQWVIPLTGLSVNGSSIPPSPTYPAQTQNLSLALFDVGTSGIFGPYQDVTRMFSQLDGSHLVGDGQWALPCDVNETMAFQFGSTTFVLEPTDYLIGPVDSEPDLCLSWPVASPPSSDGVDWQLGTPFLRTVYSIFSLGIDTKEPPMIGLYPLNNATAPVETFEEVVSFFSTASETVATNLPDFPLATPSFTTPAYAFNTSVPAPAGEVVASGLATSTYSAALGTHHANLTSIPTITPSPTLATFLITDPAGHTVTSISTAAQQSITLGRPPGWNGASMPVMFPGRAALLSCVLSFLISCIATFHFS